MTNNGDRAILTAGIAVILDALGKPFSAWAFFAVSFFFAAIQTVELVQRVRDRRRRATLIGRWKHKVDGKIVEALGIESGYVILRHEAGMTVPFGMSMTAFYQTYRRAPVAVAVKADVS